MRDKQTPYASFSTLSTIRLIKNIMPSASEGNARIESPVPLGSSPVGPIKWSKWYGYTWAGWKKFKPIFLSSSNGIHAIIEPAGEEWWERNKKAGVFIPGYSVRTSNRTFIMQGSTTPIIWKEAIDLPVYGHTVVITDMESGFVVAVVSNDLRSVRFDDEDSFVIRFNGWIPFIGPHQYEFFDLLGTKQFHYDRKKAIWPEPGANRKHLLSLIIINRFLVDLITAEAPG